jgi:endonuclease/exonuclease/phosphatase family metal-dependent hydrolase
MDLRPMIADDPDTIMLGDFNFGDGEPEEGEITSGFEDIWAHLRPGESGYTWDMEKSWMARRFAYRGERSRRLDRILVRSERLEARDVRLFGEEPIRGRRGHHFASDHFGVLGTLSLRH